MEKEFKVDAVLCILYDIKPLNKEMERQAVELVKFLTGDEMINETGIALRLPAMKAYLATCYPELAELEFDMSMDFNKWFSYQRKKFPNPFILSPMMMVDKDADEVAGPFAYVKNLL